MAKLCLKMLQKYLFYINPNKKKKQTNKQTQTNIHDDPEAIRYVQFNFQEEAFSFEKKKNKQTKTKTKNVCTVIKVQLSWMEQTHIHTAQLDQAYYNNCMHTSGSPKPASMPVETNTNCGLNWRKDKW